MSEAPTDLTPYIEAARQGDEAAAGVLINELYPLVIKIIRGHRPRRTAEEDLAQIIFTRIFRKLDSYSGKAPLPHWVSRIAVNTCLNHLKAEKVRPELRWADLTDEQCAVIESLHRTSADLHPSNAIGARELVDQLLDCLPAKDRLLIQWLYLDQKSIQEIHEATGWSESVIKVRSFRARQRMRKLWKDISWREAYEPYRASVDPTLQSGYAEA